jgi:thiaminase
MAIRAQFLRCDTTDVGRQPMPRLPVYVACAAGAAGIGYVGYHWVYEPLSTVQQHAEDTLQATMFYHQRFLQRAQMLAREITEGKTDKMLSLYSRCMIVREEAMAEDMLQHEALSRILDEVVRQRCLPLDFREEALSRLQAYTAAVTYVAYILYFKIFGWILGLVPAWDPVALGGLVAEKHGRVRGARAPGCCAGACGDRRLARDRHSERRGDGAAQRDATDAEEAR